MSQETRDISLDGEIQDSVDPDVIEDDPMMEPEPEPEPMMEPEPEPMMEHDPEPTGLENEFKTVPGVQAPQAEVDAEPEPSFEPQSEPQPQHKPEGDDDVLFGDAPEQRTKNPRYY